MILSIDPSVSLCGLAFTELKGKSVICLHNKLISVGSRVRHNDLEKDTEKNLGRRYLQIRRIVDELNEEIDNIDKKNELTDIVIEAPFFMAGKPNAFGPLIEVIFGIKAFVASHRNIPVHTFAPMEVKVCFARKSNASKDEMRSSLEILVKTKEVIIDKRKIPELSEHEVDAIAVGYSYWFPLIKKLCEKEHSS